MMLMKQSFLIVILMFLALVPPMLITFLVWIDIIELNTFVVKILGKQRIQLATQHHVWSSKHR